MRRQNEKHNLCVRLCFFDAKYEKKWDHAHARIAGRRYPCHRSPPRTGNPPPRANCGSGLAFSVYFQMGWQSTPTRELRVENGLCDGFYAHWQSTPTRELRGQFVCNCKGCRGLRTCILFRIGFENGENTASPAIRRGNTLRRPFTDGGGTHCLRRAWSVWDMPCPSMVCEGKGK